MTDDELVYFFAYGKNSDLVPGPSLRQGYEWLDKALKRLVELRILDQPQQTDSVKDVIARARIACQRYDIHRSR